MTLDAHSGSTERGNQESGNVDRHKRAASALTRSTLSTVVSRAAAEGAGGPVDFDSNGDLRAALYNVYTYKDGKQDVIRQLRIRK